ncbi:hypothetical protein POMI540_3588 [Schizosaccharomyces pombe]
MSYLRSGIVGFLAGASLSYAAGVQALISTSKQNKDELLTATEALETDKQLYKKIEKKIEELESSCVKKNSWEIQESEWKAMFQTMRVEYLELLEKQKTLGEVLNKLVEDRQTKFQF